MQQTQNYDLIIIGGGSGGIAAAKKASSYGKKCAIIEKSLIGGTCINLGCVPKKNLIPGTGSFTSKNQITVNNENYKSDSILIATGSKAEIPQIKGKEFGITSDGFFELKIQPKNVAIIGSGYIAVELANVFKGLGSSVDMFIRKDTVLSKFDQDIQIVLTNIIIDKGIVVHKNCIVNELQENINNTKSIVIQNNEKFEGFDTVIFAIGRIPNTESLNLEKIGLNTTEEGFIEINEYQETNIEQIYAVGDVTGQAMLTPVAIACSRRLIDRIIGKQNKVKVDFSFVPTVVFSHPPVATIGLTQEQSVQKYGINQIAVYVSNFTNLYFALFPQEKKEKTFFKIIVLLPDEKVIGFHAVGMGSDELLQGFAVAIQMGVTKEQLDQTIAIHPTAAEEFVTMKNRILLGQEENNK